MISPRTDPRALADTANPCGMRGLAFVEFTAPEARVVRTLLAAFGFNRRGLHRATGTELWEQGEIRLTLAGAAPSDTSHAATFAADHGPSVSALGFAVDDPAEAFEAALARGAQAWSPPLGRLTLDAPAIVGIGGSLIYFVRAEDGSGAPPWVAQAFGAQPLDDQRPGVGLLRLDHLTHNVAQGGLAPWSRFYRHIFGFTEVRTFDIRGRQTGLRSYALRSPDGSFCIPINEGTEEASQIETFLRDYRGEGVQHLAFESRDLLGTLDALAGRGLRFLDIDPSYYEEAFARVPNVREAPDRIIAHQALIDGDEEGYLLQIFTEELLGPIFIELIQREQHNSFGEGNFGALFRSIERDQERRGVLSAASATP